MANLFSLQRCVREEMSKVFLKAQNLFQDFGSNFLKISGDSEKL